MKSGIAEKLRRPFRGRVPRNFNMNYKEHKQYHQTTTKLKQDPDVTYTLWTQS